MGQCGGGILITQLLHGEKRERFLVEKNRVIRNARRLQFRRQRRPDFIVPFFVFRHDARLELHLERVALHFYDCPRSSLRMSWNDLPPFIAAPKPMTAVDSTSVAMPPPMSRCAFLLEPFHSWKIQPHIVANIMMLAMCSVHEAKSYFPICVAPIV